MSFLVLLLSVLATGVDAQPSAANHFVSENGRFQVSYESRLSPIAINQIHSWTLHVTDAAGDLVSDAKLSIEGGMPEHNHGLATAPSIEATGAGNYELQGIRFHMMGYWELELTVNNGSVTDTVIIPLEL